MTTDRRGGPPRTLEWLCAATLPYRQREIVLGDLHEEYVRRARTKGRGAAGRWYLRETARSLVTTLSKLPWSLLAPRNVRTEDLVTVTWFALVAMIVVACVFASRL